MECLLIQELKKVYRTLQDISALGVNEVKRGARYSHEKFTNLWLQKQRKDLLADLGRTVYEFYLDNEHAVSVENFFNSPEIQDVLKEIREIELQMDSSSHAPN